MFKTYKIDETSDTIMERAKCPSVTDMMTEIQKKDSKLHKKFLKKITRNRWETRVYVPRAKRGSKVFSKKTLFNVLKRENTLINERLQFSEIDVFDGNYPISVKEQKNKNNANPSKIKENDSNISTGSNVTMGAICVLDPAGSSSVPDTYSDLSIVDYLFRNNHFENFSTLKRLRDGSKQTLTIALDCEWFGSPRYILSYQFALIYNNVLHEYVFLNPFGRDFKYRLDELLAYILSDLSFDSFAIDKYLKGVACIGFDDDGNAKWETFPLRKGERQYADDWHVLVKTGVSDKGYPVWTPHPYNVSKCDELGVINKFDSTVKTIFKDCKDAEWCGMEWKRYKRRLDVPSDFKIDVQLVCHAGKVDISCFAVDEVVDDFGDLIYEDFDGFNNVMRHLSEVQGGVVTNFNHRMVCKDVTLSRKRKRSFCYLVSLSVRDTMCQAPAGSKSLDSLGSVVGVRKLDPLLIDGRSYINKDDMLGLLMKHPLLFLEYAALDSFITLLYFTSVYGLNQTGAMTITSGGASVMKSMLCDYFNVDDNDAFMFKFRGLKRVSKGLVPNPQRSAFLEASNLEPINDDSAIVQMHSSNAYHGGFNACSRVGWYEKDTFDYDLCGAYPTAMALTPDINWEDPIASEIIRRELTLKDFSIPVIGEYPLVPFVGYVSFEFPSNVLFPSLPVSVDGSLLFPRTSDGIDGVYVCGPEVFLALKLGAKVFCKRGFMLNVLTDSNGVESRSLGHAVRDLLVDRGLAKNLYGKGSLEELLLKTIANSGYGKVAQNVVRKQTWDAYVKDMVDLGCSSITNPFSACYITSLVRAELIATMNELESLDYEVYSVTTDGFITNAPSDVVLSSNMHGFKRWMEQSRMFLSGKPDVWEVKHKQHTLLNLTTRGNMSLELGGVCAHNSSRSPYVSGSLEDRLWFITACLSRTDAISYKESVWTTFKDLVQGLKPFEVVETTRRVRMDFDLKRKPDVDSIRDVDILINNVNYTHANFSTTAYDTIDDFRRFRAVKESFNCLRTKADWDRFYVKLRLPSGTKLPDLERSIVRSIVTGCRVGLWVIDELANADTSVEDKCEWINSKFNLKKPFTKNDWKNSRKPDRVGSILPFDILKDDLMRLNAHSFKN